jgi:hypothetical protein
MDATLPDWLTPSPAESQRRSTRAERELERTQFEIAFPSLLEALGRGRFLRSFIRHYPIALDEDRFKAWIMRDVEREKQYYDAKRLGCDSLVDDVMDFEAMDEATIPEDIERYKARVGTVKWYVAAHDRRYRATQQIEINQNISIVAALAAANGRLIEHEQTKLIEQAD